MRVGQGVGGAFLFANSKRHHHRRLSAQRRVSLWYHGAAIGRLHRTHPRRCARPHEWRLVFLVSVPVGLFGTVWAALKLRDNGTRTRRASTGTGTSRLRSVSSRCSLALSTVCSPYGGHAMGWTSPSCFHASSADSSSSRCSFSSSSRSNNPCFSSISSIRGDSPWATSPR